MEDQVNQMLGRDPKQHRPPRLCWGNLIRALAKAGIDAIEEDLIAAPLELSLADEVKIEIRVS